MAERLPTACGAALRWLLLLALATAAAAAPPESALPEGTALEGTAPRARIPGTDLVLPVPEGFRVSRELPGLGRPEDLTSVLVTQLAVPLPVSRLDFDAESLSARGLRVDRIVEVRVDGADGWLAHASQRAGGLVFRKWILLLGDDVRSALVTATTPLDLEAVHREALVGILRGARWQPAEGDERGGGEELPFRVPEVPPLRIVRSAANAVVLSDPSAPTGGVAPLVSVGVSRSRVAIGDLAVFARRRLQESASIEEIEVEEERPRELDGMPAHEITARAREVSSGLPVAVMQVLAFDGARYFIVQAIVDERRREALAPPLERLVAGFERVR